MSPATYFPLRWESTGDQWWYASPIDWAAANGHYDLVRELLRLDANHLIKLTSLRRIRRLETVWDDDAARFHDVARCRSAVAKKLLAECEINNKAKNDLSNKNSLIGGGYGGWLLYTAASAGDAAFVAELLERDPLLVFGEGEYGVTDILYAAARSGDSGVFKLVLDFAAAPRFGGGEGEVPAGYRLEIMNRAIHAAARGGNVALVKELLSDCSDDALAYRDVQGATVLHAAAARGQVQVVRELGSSWGLIDATDKQGNTALHIAAQRGHLAAVEALIEASPSSITATNHAGDTFLHSVVAGFQTPGFRRLDRQMELMRHLLSGQLFPVEAIINSTNSQGKTPLHLAIASNTHSDLVELLMTVASIDVNVRDGEGATPLDVLRRRPACPSSDLLARRLVSAGGVLTARDYSARRAIASHIKRQSMGSSPGTSFRISDGEIFLYTAAPGTGSSCSPEPVPIAAGAAAKATAPAAPSAAQRLKRLLHWPKAKKPAPAPEETAAAAVPLRQRFSNAKAAATATTSSNNSNKRSLSVRSREASPGAKKKMAVGMMRAVPAGSRRSRSSSLSKLSFSSLSSNEEGGKRAAAAAAGSRRSSVMNQYLCFGGATQGVEPPAAAAAGPYDLYERSVLAAA